MQIIYYIRDNWFQYYFQDSWYASLYEKFRNERKSIKDDPEVILRKRKPKESSKECVKAKLRRGAINWEPPFPEGEDEVSLQRHKDFMKSEFEKKVSRLGKDKQTNGTDFPQQTETNEWQYEHQGNKRTLPYSI